jgi:hypothetical protein
MTDKFKMPETREEAVERKEALLEKINKYNEEYFSGTTTLTEEEINLIQEEYQFLDELVDIEADYAKVEEPKEQRFLDKVSILVWIYAMFAFFSGFYFLQQPIGLNLIFSNVYGWMWFENLGNTGIWFLITACFFLYPFLLGVIGFILKLVAFKKSLDSKKAFKYVFYGQLLWLLANFVYIYFTVVDYGYQLLKK